MELEQEERKRGRLAWSLVGKNDKQLYNNTTLYNLLRLSKLLIIHPIFAAFRASYSTSVILHLTWSEFIGDWFILNVSLNYIITHTGHYRLLLHIQGITGYYYTYRALQAIIVVSLVCTTSIGCQDVVHTTIACMYNYL